MTSSRSTLCCFGVYVLFFIELDTRRVYLTGITANPVGAWVVQQARNLTMILAERTHAVGFLVRDGDAKFTSGFDEVFRSERIRHPHAGAGPEGERICRAFIGTVRRECLDRMLIFNRRQLEYVLAEYVEHYNTHRPHRSLDQTSPLLKVPGPRLTKSPGPPQLRRSDRLGGLIHEYKLAA